MSLVLRAIQKAKWYTTPWLPRGEIQADALQDLNSKGNKLSFYFVDEERTRLERVAVALATTKDYLKEVDYALLEESLIGQIGIKIEKTDGNTPDNLVNQWHLEFVELTVDKIAELARIIYLRGEIGRVLEKRLKNLIIAGVHSNQLERHLMKPEMQSRVSNLLAKPNS